MAKYRNERNDVEEEEVEEALSLSDLPIDLAKAGETQVIRRGSEKEGNEEAEKEGSSKKDGEEEGPEFDFGWWGNNGPCGSSELHMCTADELFFKGQILPRRLSTSSDNGVVYRSLSRSESKDHGSASGLIESRSSSIGSYHSYTSSSSSSSATIRVDHHKRPFGNHHFQIQMRPSHNTQPMNALSGYNDMSQRSSQNNERFFLWNFFRTGLVRGPSTEMELRDIKFRGLNNTKRNSAISRNSSNSSSSGSGDNSNAKSNSNSKGSGKGLLINKNLGGLLGGANCKCSVETIPLNTPSTKMGSVPVRSVAVRGSRMSGTDEKLHKDPKMKDERMMIKEKQAAMSRQRTSEWLEELSLSHAS